MSDIIGFWSLNSSDDELEQSLEEWENKLRSAGWSIKPNRPASDDAKYCSHQWKKYVGFTQVYDFCTVCDAKRYDDGKIELPNK